MERAATGGRRRLGIAVVRGDSMRPVLRPGQRLLVLYGSRVRPGRVVVARFVDGTLAVKRVAERRGSGWWLLSDNAEAGVDSRHRGAVPDADVAGVVRARVWPWPRLL
jgi:nickel-type superoxide dismutase maturation protease